MSPDAARAVMRDGCDCPPRVGGWCHPCDGAVLTSLGEAEYQKTLNEE